MTHPTDDEIMELAVRYFGEQAAHASTGLKRFARALLAAQPAQERQTYKPGNGGDCAICRQPEGDHYRHGNDCPDMRGVGQAE